jgi:hypothetical protein
MRKNRIMLVAAMVIAIAAGTAAALPATAAPQDARPPVKLAWSPEESQFIKQVGMKSIVNQDELSDLLGWLMARPGFVGSGYVGSMVDLAHKSMTIMWHGSRTPLLAAFIREGARRGIPVYVQHRRYSLQQIHAGMAAIWKQAAEGRWAGFQVSAIAGVAAVENGLTVYGRYTSLPAARRAPQVKSLSASVAGVPVHVVPGRSIALDTSRINDTAPFNAGDFMWDPVTISGSVYIDGCSTGFGIDYQGFYVTTTARHCAESVYYEWSAFPNASGTQFVNGSVTSGGGAGVRVMNSGGSPLMFKGGPTSTTKDEVIGLYNPSMNSNLCSEGGNSGEHCNLIVSNLDVQIMDGIGTIDTIEAIQQTAGHIATMAGDSGGPVMSLSGITTAGLVKAAGMIQASKDVITSQSQCGNSNYFIITPPSATTCGKQLLFTSENQILRNLNADLLTQSGPVAP